jgi:hypothetical protein
VPLLPPSLLWLPSVSRGLAIVPMALLFLAGSLVAPRLITLFCPGRTGGRRRRAASLWGSITGFGWTDFPGRDHR